MATGYLEWVKSVTSLIGPTSTEFPEHGKALQTVLDRLNRRLATLTFGGRFKSGKSTLLNAALRRPLLPTRDLPETGSNCHLLAGDRDEAALVGKDNWRRSIQCDTESLRGAISLRGGQNGLQRLGDVARVEIRLNPFPGGPYCKWIDPPGLFDRPEMTERAWAAARDADIIVWVLRSQQFLGEEEAGAIAEFIEERGPAAVVFVENAFLPKDVPDPWHYHLNEIAPVNRDKLMSLTGKLGLHRNIAPELIVVSAQQILTQGTGYGADCLSKLLKQLADPNGPRIRLARLQWAVRVLAQALKAARALYGVVRNQNLERHQLADKANREATRRRDRFDVAATDAVAEFLTNFESAAAECGESVAAAILSAALSRDDSYTQKLNTQLQSRALAFYESMVKKVNQEATHSGLQQLAHRNKQKLRHLCTPPSVTISVPDSSSGKTGGGAVAGAVAGAAIGSVVPIIGTGFGALLCTHRRRGGLGVRRRNGCRPGAS